MGASKCISMFLLTSLLICALVYIVLLARIGKHDNHKVAAAISNLNSDRSLRNDVNLQALTNPFSICPAFHYETHNQGVGVVILVHNKLPNIIIQTVKSVLANSGDITPQIMVVDDHSSFPVKKWPEWRDIKSSKPIKVITLEERKGYAYSKSIASKHLKSLGGIDVVVFLEGGSIVSQNWLSPLLHTLGQHPTSLVYPSIDIFDDTEDYFYQSGNTIATFDWSLRLTWEDVDALQKSNTLKLRFPLVDGQPHAATDAVYSPAVPATFAVRLEYLESIGDFSTSPLFSTFGSDNIELSLRSWLCSNGGIIRQPCSRVAWRRKIHKKDHAHEETEHANHVIVDIFEGVGSETGMHADDEYTQYDADADALTIAEMWMGGEPYTQFVLNSRFGWGSSDEGGKDTGRFPYDVKKQLDARHPHQLSDMKSFTNIFDHNQCKRFAWYLYAVYPGLSLDLPISEMHRIDNLQEKNMKAMMSPFTKQYSSTSDTPSSASDHYTPIKARYRLPSEKEVAEGKRQEYEQDMAYKVRDELLCINVNEEKCNAEVQNKGCVANVGYTMFHCPKACGFCDGAGEKLCIDFYLNKCPKLAAEGQCTEPSKANWMTENCRQSCKICTRHGDTSSKPKAAVVKTPVVLKTEDALASTVMNPYVAQEQWKAGKNPDVIGNNPCFLKANANGKLLDNIHIENTVPTRLGNRLFCGTYTYEKNHDTNVRIMKQTWTKKCDGWMAFSTVDDPTIPSVNIKHEGDESWNNMWQKIRSIWKYVHKNYRDDFDWFLLGGDDMYYIVENLKTYLESKEVVAAKQLDKGLFLGRRFFPPTQVEFNSGGAGYILDRVALDVLVSHIDGPPCMPHQKGFWEDVNTASCLQKVQEHIFPFDTRDEFGRERFHPFQPANHLTYQIPKNPDWYAKYNPELKVGLECCSANSVSFHYAKGDFMQKLNNYIYHCPSKLDLRRPGVK
mmetsp:Transcript_9694/g.16078  ORF Transcript_9694/g.16078 Transcript_9694/m.16078 type:complete len:955 (+) Transcript_9694:76-2940(+)